jgi:hypothetical protein
MDSPTTLLWRPGRAHDGDLFGQIDALKLGLHRRLDGRPLLHVDSDRFLAPFEAAGRR